MLVVVGAVVVSGRLVDELGIGDGEQAIAVLDLYECIVPEGAVLASGALWCVQLLCSIGVYVLGL